LDVGSEDASQLDRQRAVSALSDRILENGTLVHKIAKIVLHNSLELDVGGRKPAAVRVAHGYPGLFYRKRRIRC
jgi:hypothetical protein